MERSNSIGKRIEGFRKNRGLTQAELAKEMGVKRETVVQWESNSRDLKTSATVKLADFFGVTCDEILRGIKAENVDINKKTGLSDKAIDRLIGLNLSYNEPQNIELIVKTIALWELENPYSSGKPPVVTDDEFNLFLRHLGYTYNKRILNAISSMISSALGVRVIEALENYATTDFSASVTVDMRQLGHAWPGNVNLDKRAVFAEILMEAARQYRNERSETNADT